MPNSDTQPRLNRKLIEVDLPLGVININTAAEPIATKGHPWTLHQWWARRRLTACRVVIFASMVDDPSSYLNDSAEILAERQRLHSLLERLSLWRNSGDESLIAEARYEIACSVARQRKETAPREPTEVLKYLGDPEKNLNIYDPFSGGGCIPLEAQRLGLRTTGTDLNPVAVLITKALVEIPYTFSGQQPVNPEADPMGMNNGGGRRGNPPIWRGATGLANDINYYGRRMRKLAHIRVGYLYPNTVLPDGSDGTVLAWLWARTVRCPSPACGFTVPLVATFQLSSKRGNQHWIRPVADPETRTISFEIQDHNSGIQTRDTASSKGATCLSCKVAISSDYLHQQATAGNMGEKLIATIAVGNRGKKFLSPTSTDIEAAESATPPWRPEQSITYTPKVSALGFGTTHWHEMFTERQLTSLAAFTDLLLEIRHEMTQDGASQDYADAVCTYLALAIDKATVAWSRFGVWHKLRETIEKAYRNQAIPMVWDYPEANPFSDRMQSWLSHVDHVAKVVQNLPLSVNEGVALQADAATTVHATNGPVIVTDPPYYNNINYADLSDYLYVWMRRSLRDIYPNLFAGILTPKDEEMTAIPSRFDNHTERFENLLNQTLRLIKEHCSPEFPSSIFYAYKQKEEDRAGRTSTGWETMLSALVSAGFQIVGTWPMRTEQTKALKSKANVLASSVILVCRPRPETAPVGYRSDFMEQLAKEMPRALDHLTLEGHIAPVDLRQAAIGPGMAVYSRFQSVTTFAGEPVTVREALSAITHEVSTYLREQSRQLDVESQFCLEWIETNPSGEGEFDQAETLARFHGISIVDRLERRHGLLTARSGRVKLRGIEDYESVRSYPSGNDEMTAWEGCLRMAWQMEPGEERSGILGCVEIAQNSNGRLDDIERLARILYDIYDKREDSRHAVAFNSVVMAWPEIIQRAYVPTQPELR